MGSSLRNVDCRNAYRSRAHGWNGATLAASLTFFNRPYSSICTLTPVSFNPLELGRAQYPVSPGAGPRRGFPSGQRGVGRDAPALATGLEKAVASGVIASTRFPVLVRTTESPQSCRLPSLATGP